MFKCRRVRAVVVPAEPHRNCYSIRAANSISHANYLCGFFLLTSRWHLKQCDFQLSSAALYHRLVVCVRVCVCVVFFSGLCVTHANRGSVRPKIQTEKTHTGLMQMGRMYCVCADGRRANVRKIRHAWSTGV